MGKSTCRKKGCFHSVVYLTQPIYLTYTWRLPKKLRKPVAAYSLFKNYFWNSTGLRITKVETINTYLKS